MGRPPPIGPIIDSGYAGVLARDPRSFLVIPQHRNHPTGVRVNTAHGCIEHKSTVEYIRFGISEGTMVFDRDLRYPYRLKLNRSDADSESRPL
jgi:hypothetical protein